jgi:hypothetical protein
MAFVVSLSNHEWPFDGLRANGLNSIFGTRIDLSQKAVYTLMKPWLASASFRLSGVVLDPTKMANLPSASL